jgi:hypothetical protein
MNAMRIAIVGVILFAQVGTAVAAGDKFGTMTHEEYTSTANLVPGYFFKLYSNFGDRVRVAEVARACGDTVEAEALVDQLKEARKVVLNRLLEADINTGKVKSMAAVVLVHEAASSMMTGYALGYGEGMKVAVETLKDPIRTELCARMRTSIHGWLKEGPDLPKR